MKKSKTKRFVFLKRIEEAQFLRIMRVTVFLLLLGMSNVFAGATYSQSVTFSFSKKNITLGQLFKEIQKQSEFVIFYKDSQVDLNRKVDVDATDASVEEVLRQALKGAHLDFKVYDRQIVVFAAPALQTDPDKNEEIAIFQPQQKEITGKITDSDRLPLPGVSVIVKGTTIGTVTNADGKFSLKIPLDAETLQFSFVGMHTQEIPIGGDQTTFSIIMEEATIGLEEVVAVGYGTQEKASVVGSISTIKADELNTVATANLTNTIGGYVSGVITKMGGGKPGDDDAQVFIRGRGTTNSTEPLVLVDGIESDFARINPNDIESFSVLKDASATAVYGVRGANGVILITTKQGLAGVPKIQVSSQYRLHRIIKYPKMLNSYDFARLFNEAYLNGGNTSKYYNEEDLAAYRDHSDPYGHPDVDWFQLLTKPYFLEHRHDISIRGGTQKLKYYVSGEVVSQDGAYKQWDDMDYSTNATYDRFNIRSNFDFAVSKTTDLSLNVSTRIEKTNDVISGSYGGVGTSVGIWDEIMVMRPNLNYKNPDGSFSYIEGLKRPYPALRQGGFRKGRLNFIQASFKLNQKLNKITKGLSFRLMSGLTANYGYTYSLTEFPALWNYDPANETYTLIERRVLPNISVGGDYINQLYHFETSLNYDRIFNNIHKVTALAVYNQDRRIVSADAPINHLGVAGRITYGYNKKYLGEINVGYNGSDQFEIGRRFALLPAASLGWVVSEEPFWKDKINFIKYLKLRGSYGTVGNDRLGNFLYLYKSNYNRHTDWVNRNWRGFPSNGYYTIREGFLGNDQITWEIAVKQNYGADFNLFTENLGFSFDYFYEKRSNILTTRNTITRVFGVESSNLPPENIGIVENKGVEIEVTFNKKIENWEFNFNGNFSYAKNKILEMDEIIQPVEYMNQTGKSIGQFFGYQWTGEFYSYEELGYVWDETVEGANKYVLPEGTEPSVPVPSDLVYPGDPKFVDRNKDGVIDFYDRGAIGHTSTPELIYGLNLNVKYKRLGLQMFWQGAGRFSASFNAGVIKRPFHNDGPGLEIYKGRWAYFPEDGIDTRETATYPRLIIGGSNQAYKESTLWLFNGEYLRLKNIELSYLLPEGMVRPLRINRGRIFLLVNNLITFSHSDLYDPEAPAAMDAYPQTMFFGAGVNIEF
jgi:TonB-linked SusC/RagA family outer membrane protein